MRVALAISAVMHAAFLMWLVLAPASKPFDPAYAKAILVDLVPPPDDRNAPEREPPTPDSSKPDASKPDSSKSDSPQTPDQPKPAAAVAQAPANKPAGGGQDHAAETAARLAQMLDPPADLPASLSAPPTENKTSLAPGFIARFKAQVRKCFAPLADPPDTPNFTTEIHIALKPNGALAADPSPTFFPAVPNGPVLVERAKQAVKQCQPYNFLPADKYADWQVIDLVFSYDGPADEATARAAHQTAIFLSR